MAHKPTKKQFEKSSYDDDKGVKEGSPADKKRDKGEFAKMRKDAKDGKLKTTKRRHPGRH